MDHYINLLKERLESTYKLLNNEKDVNELDNSKIIELINKNIEVLTRGPKNSYPHVEEAPDSNKSDKNENSFHDSNSLQQDFKTVDYYIKKKISKDSSNSQENVSLKISPKK
jgi:hypothetical protein